MAEPIETDALGGFLVPPDVVPALEWFFQSGVAAMDFRPGPPLYGADAGARVMDSDGVVWVRTAGGWEPEADTPTIVEAR